MAFDLSAPILIVDDTDTVRRILVTLVKRIGFTKVDVAPNGMDALFKMKTKKYGLVISDWQMEPVDGFALLKTIRSDPELAATPFIMITLYSDVEKVIAARNAGVNAFISKPFTAKMLKEKMMLAWQYQPRQISPLLRDDESLDVF